MKDCRYVCKDDFIKNYKVVDDKVVVYYSSGDFTLYDYSLELEKDILLKMKKQIEDNVLFKKLWNSTYYFSLVFFNFTAIFSIDAIYRMIEDFSFFSVFGCLLSLGISFSDIMLFVNSDINLREIKKQEYFVNNEECFNNLVNVNNLDNFKLGDLIKMKEDFSKGLVRKR